MRSKALVALATSAQRHLCKPSEFHRPPGGGAGAGGLQPALKQPSSPQQSEATWLSYFNNKTVGGQGPRPPLDVLLSSPLTPRAPVLG